MTFTPRTVLIPIVGSIATIGRVARVQADATPPAQNNANLNPVTAELADWRLYEAGAIALGAFRRLHLPRKAFAVATRLWQSASGTFLSITNGPDVIGLQPSTNKSAELGLALALIMHAAQSRAHSVIATGSLSRGATPIGSAIDDVEVLPVEGIAAKLKTIGHTLSDTKGSAYPKRVHLFLPRMTSEGTPIAETYHNEITALVTDFKTAGIELIISPVATLREAIGILGIKALEITRADKIASTATAGIAVTASVILAVFLWLSATIDLSFATVNSGSEAIIQTPLRTQFAASDNQYQIMAPCYNSKQLPVYRAGETMLIKVSLKEAGFLLRQLGGYRYSVITVSEQSGIKVFPDTAFADNRVGQKYGTDDQGKASDLTIAVPVEGPTEKNKLIILVRKLRPFDNDALRKSLVKLTANNPTNLIINQAVNYLSGQAAGYLDYSFMSASKEYTCKG